MSFFHFTDFSVDYFTTKKDVLIDLVEFIKMGDKFYNTIAIGMKNENIAKDIISE